MFTDAMREYGMVVSFPLKSDGSRRVTPCSPTTSWDGKMRLPAVRRDAVYRSMDQGYAIALFL